MARDLFAKTASVLGFPKDGLSISLLAFARFFSHTLSSAQLGFLRQNVLTLAKQLSLPAAADGERAALESESLAAFAAMDKGIVLSPDALRHYAAFFTAPVFSKDEKEGSTGDEDSASSNEGKPGLSEKEKSGENDELPAAEKIRAIAEEQAGKDDLLKHLNVIPGKNKHYWAVYPFKIAVRGTVLKVFLRLLKREPSLQREDEYIIADITGSKLRYRCYLSGVAGKFRADIRVYPELSAKALGFLAKEAEFFMGKRPVEKITAGESKSGTGVFEGFDEIIVRNSEEPPSWAEDLCEEHLLSIDEEV